MLRHATPADFAAILALNDAFVAVLSPLDGERLAQLHAQAAWHRVIERDGRIEAFLLAFREGADYDGANYRWFARRYARFAYVDRIVVSGAAQAQGAGSRLYHDLRELAVGTRYRISPVSSTSNHRTRSRRAFTRDRVSARSASGGSTAASPFPCRCSTSLPQHAARVEPSCKRNEGRQVELHAAR